MARCPFAVWRPLPEQGRQRATEEKRLAIVHSAAGARETLFPFFRDSTDLESHFMIGMSGVIEQYLDTDQRADANREANDEAISIETGDGGNPDVTAWTPAQKVSLVRLLDWICDTHPRITRERATSPTGHGIGWHTMFGAPSLWTPKVKTCPGRARTPDMPGIIWQVAILGLPPTEGDDFMAALPPERQVAMADRVDEMYLYLVGPDVPQWGADNPRHNSVVTRLRYLFGESIGDPEQLTQFRALFDNAISNAENVDDLVEAVARLEADVKALAAAQTG